MRLTLLLVAIIPAAAISLLACSAPSAELLDHPIVDELNEGREAGTETFDHSIYQALLEDHVDPDAGTVDYAALAEDREQLQDYLDAVDSVDLSELTADSQHALLINIYNACTLDLIVEHYPDIDSIRNISSPWDTQRCHVGGHHLSLDEIEHNIIRPLYRDPRIHFAVNCAAHDCPHLADFAYTGEELDRQLAERTEATLSSEKFARVDDGTLRYTRVMHWYSDDFVNEEYHNPAPNLAQYIARHSTDEVRQFVEDHDGNPSISPLDYDWSLNDAH